MRVKKNYNHQSLGQVIEKLIQTYKLGDKMKEMDLVKAWDEVMGKAVSSRTREIYVKNKVLYLKLNSAPLREELAHNKQQLIKILNEKTGSVVIEDIHFA
jgi:predicted nucleic acid-binding Zn ribbon protein